jgi:hypothetical protein
MVPLEPISVAIPFYHQRKQGAIKQKAKVSHGKLKRDKMVRRRLTLTSLFTVSVYSPYQRGCHGKADGKKKSDGEAKKK